MDWGALHVFGDAVRRVSAGFPDKPALIFQDHAYSFSHINTRMNRLANGLAERGLKNGDRIAVLSRNRPEVVETFGASKAGIIVLPLNWRLASEELLHPLTDGEPTALLVAPEFVSVIETLRSKLPFVRHFIQFETEQSGWSSYEKLLAESSEREPGAAVMPQDPLCLMYTSGTTGKPKGAVLSHGALMRNAHAVADWLLGLRENDVALAAMPFFHVGGMWYHLFPTFVRGCTTVLLPQFSPADVLSLMVKHGVTYSHFVPTMIHALVNDPSVERMNLSRMRIIYYAASSIPLELLRQAMALFPHCDFVQSYGSTEAGVVTLLSADDHRSALRSAEMASRLLSCGRRLHCDLRIVDADKAGIGEIAVRSDRIMAGYWRNPDATAQVMGEGWLRTGDLATLDSDGYLTIADRKDDMIVSGGENVYPREVEDALYRDPAILEAAVFGLPDPRWVEKVAAAVVLRPGAVAAEREIIERSRAHLAGYKCPKTVVFCDSLPKSGAGKVLKADLRRMFSTRQNQSSKPGA